MSTHAGLTAKQARFVAEYLVDGNGARAAVAAGYGAPGARVAAHRLLTKANVQKALRARQAADATRLSLQRDDVLRGLLQAVERARIEGNPAAMISGWASIGKMLGLYAPEVRRREISDDGGDAMRRIEAMTNQELAVLVGGA